MKGGNKYGKPVPGQPQPQSINRPREHGEIKDSDINTLRNKRDVWKINTVPFKGGHYAAYPPKLVETLSLIHISALIGYIWYEAPDHEKNFTTLLEMINASEGITMIPLFFTFLFASSVPCGIASPNPIYTDASSFLRIIAGI